MKKELIYQMMNGEVDLDETAMLNGMVVEDEFSKDKECGKLYDRVYSAKIRLGKKLGTEEDADVEEIIGCMNDISRILAFKMYEYGAAKKR